MTESNTILKTHAIIGEKRISKVALLPGVRKCNLCGGIKMLSEFSFLWKNENNGADYYRRECKECRKKVARRPDQQEKSTTRRAQWRRANSENYWRSHTNSRFKKEYGITLEQAFSMLDLQKGMCANRACGKTIEFGARKKVDKICAVVDHCHKTGKVRGILCDACNKTIGLSGENVNILLGAAEYVAKFDKLGSTR